MLVAHGLVMVFSLLSSGNVAKQFSQAAITFYKRRNILLPI